MKAELSIQLSASPILMRHSLLKRLTALLLLMAHAITGTSALPALTTLAADLEGSHAVMVSQSQHGTQVVLHHRPHEYTPAVDDHKHALARMLVRLCRTSEEGDHKLSVEALSSGLAEEKEKQARGKKQAKPEPMIPGQSWTRESPASVSRVRAIHAEIERSHGTRLGSIHVMLRSVRLMI